MLRSMIGGALAGGAALLAGCATMEGGTTSYACTRAGLGAAVDAYLAAQAAGDPSLMRLAEEVSYKEQFQAADLAGGIVSTPLAVAFTNTLIDEQRCETFTEIAVTDPSHPYMLGLHLVVADGAIAEIDTIVVDDDDWLFSAEGFVTGVADEDWGPIPEAERDSRETIVAAADPYFAMFKDVSIQPPWYDPCVRQEGGLRIGCSLSAPLNVEFPNRNYLVDPEIGAVVALVLFNEDLPDSHLFRVEGGKVRYIHTITNCMGDFNCNFGLPDTLAEERRGRGGRLE
jgi:hypothetical protein